MSRAGRVARNRRGAGLPVNIGPPRRVRPVRMGPMWLYIGISLACGVVVFFWGVRNAPFRDYPD
jgi:hypothetical protein